MLYSSENFLIRSINRARMTEYLVTLCSASYVHCTYCLCYPDFSVYGTFICYILRISSLLLHTSIYTATFCMSAASWTHSTKCVYLARE